MNGVTDMNEYLMMQPADHTNSGANYAVASQKKQSALQSKNVRIHDRRTSVRLEPEMWRALKEISDLEKCSIHDLCGAVHDLKDPDASFTAALRVFLMEYYRTASKSNQQVSRVQQQIKAATQRPDTADIKIV